MPSWIIPTIYWISLIFTFLYSYYAVYVIVGLFCKRTFPKAKNHHKYAILIAARNEETVLANLIESIRQQDYPQDLIDIFVVADNCTDRTAQIARSRGAHCYERTDPDRRTKGYALQYLVEQIREDYGLEAFDGYFVFDADNLLKKDYVRHMNDSFDAGEKIITSYRNTKNFSANWISASYGLHWLRTTRVEHRARSKFRLAARIQGTGFLFSNEIIAKDGWRYTSLTEDRAFCADAVVQGYRISYNHEAQFYDEQPVDLRIAMRQRIRWSKGHLQAVADSGGKLLLHIFRKNTTVEYEDEIDAGRAKRLLYGIRKRFMCFDMLTTILPRNLIVMVCDLMLYLMRLFAIFTAAYGILSNDTMTRVLDAVLGLFGAGLHITNASEAIILFLVVVFLNIIIAFIRDAFIAAFIFFMERKRTPPIKWYKKLWFCLHFALFDYIGKISMVIALCSKVEWKPIPHNADIDITKVSGQDEIDQRQSVGTKS